MLQNYTISSVASVFYKYPTKEQYLKGISRDIKLAHTSVKKYLDQLLKLSIIKEEVIEKGKRKFPIYKANLNNENYRKYKTIFNFASIHESGLIEHIYETLFPKSIILFGSFQKGEDTEESDIDIFLECKKEEIKLAKFEKELNRKIQLHFKENFEEYPIELKNNIINGIVLKGFLVGYK